MTTSSTEPAPARTAEPADRPQRIHGLDALRGGALLLGIVLHAFVPFIATQPWFFHDRYESMGLAETNFVIHSFRMVLFMMLAGYFGALMLDRRGAQRYVGDRAKRVLLPMIAFWPVAVFPLGLLTLMFASTHPGTSQPEVTDPLVMFSPGQLWFLLVLMECIVIAVAVRALLIRFIGKERTSAFSEHMATLFSSRAGVLVASVPYIVAVLIQGEPMSGIIEPVTIIPEVAPLVGYLGAFSVGWALRRRSDALARISKDWVAYLIVGAISLSIMLIAQGQIPLPIGAALVALGGWCVTYGLVGVCMRFLTRPRPAIRYLADASYWMYLMHLPIVVAIGISLADLSLPVVVKLSITLIASSAILLLTYQLVVRCTPIGTWLNGRKHPWKKAKRGA
ncbi:acyltransferase family protein [Nonomuraea typhae]|uniref:Acyltransferase family protein n=1 Tax=Nonomuraea typhae TaxID=2603600 RepID=A0ABW7Z436_9ACTN